MPVSVQSVMKVYDPLAGIADYINTIDLKLSDPKWINDNAGEVNEGIFWRITLPFVAEKHQKHLAKVYTNQGWRVEFERVVGQREDSTCIILINKSVSENNFMFSTDNRD